MQPNQPTQTHLTRAAAYLVEEGMDDWSFPFDGDDPEQQAITRALENEARLLQAQAQQQASQAAQESRRSRKSKSPPMNPANRPILSKRASFSRLSVRRTPVQCIVEANVKPNEAHKAWRLKVVQAVLGYVKKDIAALGDPSQLPDSCVTISEIRAPGGKQVKLIIAIHIPETLLPMFQKLKGTKSSNRIISKQLECSVNVKFKDTPPVKKSEHTKPPITLEKLRRLVPRQIDKLFKRHFKDDRGSEAHEALFPLLRMLQTSANVYKSEEQKDGLQTSFDVVLRLDSGARFKFEKRFTRSGSELRVSKGTKLEFFWSHLLEWANDLKSYSKARKKLAFCSLPEDLFGVIIEFIVDRPSPEVDFRSWFSRPIVICKINLNKKEASTNKKRAGKHQYFKMILKSNPKNSWAISKRFSLPKLSEKALEYLFLRFDDFEPPEHILQSTKTL